MQIIKHSRQELIEAYKIVLRECIDQRPSGVRRKMAQVLGTHKSFISQITNPSDSTPIPHRHLDLIVEVCHLSAIERERFLSAYRAAHAGHSRSEGDDHRLYRTLHVQIPILDDRVKQQALEALICETVRGICDFARRK